MNILYIASIFPKESEGSNIYTDLAEELRDKGHNVIVVVSEEKNKVSKTKINFERKIKVLRVKIGNMYNVNLFEKAISFINLQTKLTNAIDKYLSNENFDLILFMSPPVTIESVIKYAMKKYNCKSYLMQKDIFPQNAVDLNIMSKLNPVYWYFRKQEIKLYNTASIIGCMSEKNREYILKHNNINKDKVQLFPNTIKIKNNIKKEKHEKINIIYGGNFGKPQGIDFLLKILDEYKYNKKIQFILVGKGTEKNKVYKYIQYNNIKNVQIYEFLNKNEYKKILQKSDIGLVLLDYRFTIPNIPSKTLSYLEYGIPIISATDKNTDYKEIIEKNNIGLWCESNNIKKFKENLDYLINNKNIREKIGENGRKYLEENLDVKKSVEILENIF